MIEPVAPVEPWAQEAWHQETSSLAQLFRKQVLQEQPAWVREPVPVQVPAAWGRSRWGEQHPSQWEPLWSEYQTAGQLTEHQTMRELQVQAERQVHP